LIEKVKDYINNGISYGRNRWAFQIHILNSDDSIELIDAVCNQMERGVLAIFGGVSQQSAKTIKSFVNHYNIPFITWNNPSYKTSENYLDDNDNEYEANNPTKDDDSDNQNEESEYYAEPSETTTSSVLKTAESEKKVNYLLNIHPELSSVLVSIIKYNRHKTVYYFYDHLTALDRLQSLLDYQMRETDFITNILPQKIIDLTDGIDFLRILEDEFVIEKNDQPIPPTQKMNEITVMIDFEDKDNYVKFLSQIKRLGIKKIHFHYVLVTLAVNEIDINSLRQDGLNITGFAIVDYNNYNVAKQIGDTIQTNVPFSQLKKIPYKYVLAIDALLVFCSQMNEIVGKDVHNLFGVRNLQLKNSEIFYNGRKGVSCNSNERDEWPVGKIVLNRLLSVSFFNSLY